MTELTKKVSKPRKRRKKRIPKHPLEFVENPYDGELHSENQINTGEPVEVPTLKIDFRTSSQWVSPQLNDENIPKRCLRSSMRTRRNKRKSGRVIKKTLNTPPTTLLEESCIKLHKQSTNSTLNYTEPGLPSNVSTPDELENFNFNRATPTMSRRKPLHYLFNGQTPVLKDFVILVENTPL